MHVHNAWGGSFDVALDSATDDDRSRNLDMDRAALQRLEETQQSWLLGPAEKKKKKYVDLGCMVCSRKLFCYILAGFVAALFIAGLVTLIVKTVPRHHSPPPPEDNYTIALHKASSSSTPRNVSALGITNHLITPTAAATTTTTTV
mgnify:CR=1 FL=1